MTGTRPSSAPPPDEDPIASTSALGLPKPDVVDAPAGPSNQPFNVAAVYPKQKSWTNPTDSLMNRMSGPSDQKAGLLRDPDEVKTVSQSNSDQLATKTELTVIDRAAKIIYQASKGSKFFLDQQRRDAELTIKG